MALGKSFTPDTLEADCLARWSQSQAFVAGSDTTRPAFSIQLPPPNVTGSLHMGHAFQQTLMDALARYHRMSGFNTAWIPGTDHAGIATQIVVDRQLSAQGIRRDEIGRAAFLEKVWEWKAQSGGTITSQMRRMGASVDWSREYFTMDQDLSEIVAEVFVRLYEDGLIYRGKRLVNWNPTLLTAVSDLEVVSEETQGHMWHILYPFVDGPQTITDEEGVSQVVRGMTIATTRPETMLADGALCVHPDDMRYQHLLGKKVELPLCDRQIAIIADDFVDPKFGTGCVKITGAHDFNDYACAMRHHLPMIVIFTPEAKINDNGPVQFQGMDRFAARKAVVAQLEAENYLIKVEPHVMMQPKCERTGVVVEPMLTDQWFVATTKAAPKASPLEGRSISEVALDNVATGKIKFVPENWKTTYDQWLVNIQDWCISRQLWWGHQIPAWYDESGNVFVARTEAQAQAQAGAGKKLRRDDDVLDTWFSSALVPFSTVGWPDTKNTDYQNFLPSSVLVTGFDIIFFWVARMVMMTAYCTQKIPFHTVYVHGLVRDANGQKMSKSKGNTLDPLDIIDGVSLEKLIQKRTTGLMNPKQTESITKASKKEFPEGIAAYGSDALRFTFASLATHGRNINFDLQRCEGYRNFCNKLWNATRFVLMNTEDVPTPLAEGVPTKVDQWMISTLQRAEADVARHFVEYRFDLAAQAIYQLVWDEYCDWYLELTKVQLQDSNQKAYTQTLLLRILETILRLAHPLIPFITETLWQELALRSGKIAEGEFATVATQNFPQAQNEKINPEAEQWMTQLKSVIDTARNLRSMMNVSPAARVPLVFELDSDHQAVLSAQITAFSPYLCSLAKLSDIELVNTLPATPAPTMPVLNHCRLMLRIELDLAAEIGRLDKEIARLENEVMKARTKLDNPQFADRAPAGVVAQERERLADFQSKLQQMQTQRASLK